MTQATRIWIGFVFMCIGMFMAVLDISVVGSSLTAMEHALGIPLDQLSWIQTAYLTAEVIAIPLTGWLTRAVSLRRMFVGATAGFTLASFACALCSSGAPLIAFRVIQGFCGGMLIPAVFTSVFSILPEKHRTAATAIAGAVAMVAPTIGPTVGGWLTETYSWHWIFLINVIPGIVVCTVTAIFLDRGHAEWKLLTAIDYDTIALSVIFLGTLETLLKEGPEHHWNGALVYGLGAGCAASGAAAIFQSLRHIGSFVNLRLFKERSFTLACILSFILGTGLYGSGYLLSIFLGVVRGHTPFDIGKVLIVSGIAQLIAAPIAAVLETRIDGRIVMAVGFCLFAAGLIVNGGATVNTDFDGLFWPQIFRGVSVMLCILPMMKLALDGWNEDDTTDVSGLFNLTRNLGGAIGIALIDTIVESRTPMHARALGKALEAGSANAARIVGLPTQYFHGQNMGPGTEEMRAFVEPLIQRAALNEAFNDAWFVMGGLFLLALILLPFVRWAKGHIAREAKVH
jgi:MFS transporter, DHA2 family, multidrug resistance protein